MHVSRFPVFQTAILQMKEGIDMKTSALITTIFSILVVGASFKLSSASIEESTETSCSLATLTGTYLYSEQGFLGGQPYASGGIFSFNGTGQVTSIFTNSSTREQAPATGNYAVNSNCTGTVTFGTEPTVNIYLSPNGDTFIYVRVTTDDDPVLASEVQRVSKQLIIK